VVLGKQSVAEVGKEFLNHAAGEGHVNKQLSDCVMERKNLLPNSYLRAERGYPFNYRQHGGSFFSCTFCVVFPNFYAILQKFYTLIRVGRPLLSKILAAGLPLG